MDPESLEVMVGKFIFRVRSGYLYNEAGVWAHYDAGSARARIGLTDFRQQSSGDVAFVELPAEGTKVSAGDDLINIETIKVDLVVPAPFDGEVVAVNDRLADAPELINQRPYDDGWLVELEPPGWPPAHLLDAAAYLAIMREQAEAEAN